MRGIGSAVVCFAILLSTVAAAADPKPDAETRFWTLTGTDGSSLVIGTIESIDYTDYPGIGFYTPDFERKGIRVKYKEGQVTVEWDRLQRLDIKKKGDSFSGTVVLTDGKTISPVEVIKDSRQGMYARCRHSDFAGHVTDFRSIEKLEMPPEDYPKIRETKRIDKIQIVTRKGQTVELSEAYAETPMFKSWRPGNDGPVILVAGGQQRISLNELERLEILPPGGKDKVRSLGKLTLAGKPVEKCTVSATAKLKGNTELGKYEIALGEIKTIEVNR